MLDTSLMQNSSSPLKGALIDTASNVASSLTGGLTNLITDRLQNQYAYEQNLEMWNKSNEYNKPVNQMARLREAGINPMLAMGGGNVSGNTVQASTPQMQAAHAGFDFGKINALATMNQFKTSFLEQQNLEKQGQLIEANIQKTNADTNKIATMLPAMLEAMGYKNENLRSLTDINAIRANLANKTFDYNVEAARLGNVMSHQKIANIGADTALKRGELGLMPWRKASLKYGAMDKSWDAYWNGLGLKGGNWVQSLIKGFGSIIDRTFPGRTDNNINW